MKRLFVVALVILMLVVPLVAEAAIVTVPHSSYGGGAAIVEFDRNEGNGNVLRFRCINNSQGELWFGVYLMDYEAGTETLVGERYCYPGEEIEQIVPGISIAWKCDYYPPETGWPPDCGLDMGDYQFRSRYSAP